MQQSPLHGFHVRQGASFVEFAGWEMPIRYGSVIEEHRRVREVGGLFDVSHMGRLEFRGVGAEAFLERVLTRQIGDMKAGRCRYALVCNEGGGVVDDVIVYRYEGHWGMVVNASNRAKVLEHFAGLGGGGVGDLGSEVPGRWGGGGGGVGGYEVEIRDVTLETAMVAVQGPAVMGVMRALEGVWGLPPEMPRYSFVSGPQLGGVWGEVVTVSRTGYTGEDGVEVIFPVSLAELAMAAVERGLEGGVEMGEGMEVFRPCGLGARDSLRVEAGMPLYGHELTEATTPLEAGLGFAVSLEKEGGFVGREGLLGGGNLGSKLPGRRGGGEGGGRRLVGLRLGGRRTPRQGMAVLSSQGEGIGKVTSGCLSPTLGVPIAMAYVEEGSAGVGGRLGVEFGTQVIEAEVVGLPFYKRGA